MFYGASCIEFVQSQCFLVASPQLLAVNNWHGNLYLLDILQGLDSPNMPFQSYKRTSLTKCLCIQPAQKEVAERVEAISQAWQETARLTLQLSDSIDQAHQLEQALQTVQACSQCPQLHNCFALLL